MNYYELTFTYTSPIETAIINDVLAAELGEIGFESFAENENGLQGYISDQLYNVKDCRTNLPNFHWKRGYPFYRNIGGKQGLERGMGKELFQADPHRQGLHHPRLLPRT